MQTGGRRVGVCKRRLLGRNCLEGSFRRSYAPAPPQKVTSTIVTVATRRPGHRINQRITSQPCHHRCFHRCFHPCFLPPTSSAHIMAQHFWC
ncbi:hypothetical protein P280DRAFT_10867 [Massarina eburnea CBS 473.64]|uniref:Uncharacterized protein n=1 Tax=Massarina eburnea CBS 473.64 TaxID=1395130 RepID=A0A6A6SHM7_9PLEO|nr:hypothetical protein P280DRAFT_10867 [Massarina eburnea CBS 473.64]